MLVGRRAFGAMMVVMAAVGVAPAGALGLGLRVSVSSHRGGAGARVRLIARTDAKARCQPRVSAGRLSSGLIPLTTAHGRAGWSWDAPGGAPTRWSFRVSCRSRHGSASAIVLARVRTGRGSGGLMLPDTLTIAAGHGKMRSQMLSIGTAPGSGRGAGSANPGEPGYCTWGALNQAPWLIPYVQGNARDWAYWAQRNGLTVGRTPQPGAVFVWVEGHYGHVGVVTGVINATTYTTMEMNGGSRWVNASQAITDEFNRFVAHTRTMTSYTYFIYPPGQQPGVWDGHIVQWDGDTKAQKTAWMVGPDGHRRWIPTIAIFNCLKAHGVPGPDALPAGTLDEYPDLTGQWETCSASGYGAGSGPAPSDPAVPPPTPVPTPTPTPTPSPPPTWAETVGGVSHTWTNYTNAGGTQGPSIPAYTTVQIACRLQGFKVADGNTWWYRIASPPWSNTYYVSADAFYNNGQTSGSLVGTPFVDPNVALC